MARRFYIWATVAGLEVVARLALQMGVTAVLARMLRPEDFGVSALILALVTVFSIFVAVPFEDALAQRKVLRRAHVGVALAASWLAAGVFLLVSVALGQGLARVYGQSQMALLLPAAALLLFPSAPLVIGTALARRHRQFNAMALSSLVGNAVASVATLVAAFFGAGVWALILYRVAFVFVQAGVLVALMKLRIAPRWSRRHFDDLFQFAWFALWSRLTDNLTYLVFNSMISLVFGLTELGRFNMALRVIEPVRGAVISIAHNLNFSHFQPVAQDAAVLGERVRVGCARLALFCGPAFFGIAAVAPLLIPALAGPGWEESIAITQILALGSGCMLSFMAVQTGLAASGRPQYSLYANLCRLVAISVGIVAGAGFGAVGIGFARVMGDGSDILITLWVAHRRMALRFTALLAAVAPALILSGLMAFGVAWAGPRLLANMRPLMALAASVGLGVMLYGALVALFAPDQARRLLRPAEDPA
ncbi:hypothetical protein CCR94_02810 [Rhodoblastus sphagnicola]|uniref:Polysaccharide biosynthesis protein C-terminal domain-containing protein n=1 Tax=Rhodoblastus sphagnicola TaxID=333368 RepID=A0A2S6NES1_9HYPH|nr:oligosaccharide flippase family protein [Rhodoblastus sphagnicola]MBB4196422.1 O-antigen/teichoic acid export membrane protein [Rhodoblastus sphagnicola]PPQ33118.1 hypothetical protein CCR94_02810 [Rhodoblastus sphagnicola]